MTRWLLAALGLALLLRAPIGVAQSPEDAAPKHKRLLDEVAEKYEIAVLHEAPEFPVKCSYGVISGAKASPETVANYASLFVEEFSLYPPSLIKAAKLKRVILCTDLAFAGQRRNAIPDFEHQDLYLDVSRGSDRGNYLRKVIHHEFFHIIDKEDDGKLYQDERWGRLNPPDFKYGNGGKNAQNNAGTSVLSDRYPGFLNHYSTTGVEEDKAEIFANLIVDRAYVEERLKTDEVLRAKRELMHQLLKEFCGDMDEAFWSRVNALRRSEK